MTTKYTAVFGFSRHTQGHDQVRQEIPAEFSTTRETAEAAARAHATEMSMAFIGVEEETRENS